MTLFDHRKVAEEIIDSVSNEMLASLILYTFTLFPIRRALKLLTELLNFSWRNCEGSETEVAHSS